MGKSASSWILNMSIIILMANMYGILLKEWKGVSTCFKFSYKYIKICFNVKIIKVNKR